jgi:hypothetical protein
MASALSATAAAKPQPHSQSRAEKSRPRLRGSRKLISAGAGSVTMGSSMGESLKTLTESAKSRFRRLSRCPGIGLLPVSRLGYGMRHVGSENQNPDASSIMPCHCARRRRGHANAFAQAQGHA